MGNGKEVAVPEVLRCVWWSPVSERGVLEVSDGEVTKRVRVCTMVVNCVSYCYMFFRRKCYRVTVSGKMYHEKFGISRWFLG